MWGKWRRFFITFSKLSVELKNKEQKEIISSNILNSNITEVLSTAAANTILCIVAEIEIDVIDSDGHCTSFQNEKPDY